MNRKGAECVVVSRAHAIAIGGLVVLMLMAERAHTHDVRVRTLVHHLQHPHQWHALAAIAAGRGILNVSRDVGIVPYGFRHRTWWTTDPPSCPLAKHDALPVNIIEMLTRHDAGGRRLGTSLFIEAGTYQERLARKTQYMAGLTDEAVEEYKAHMRRLSGAVVNSCDDALRLSCRLSFLIHFGREAGAQETEAIRTAADAITGGLNGVFTRDIGRAKVVLHGAVCGTAGGMTRRWIVAGMCTEDAYVEFAHNIFGMTLQWAHLLRRLPHRSPPETLVDAAHAVLDDLPARVAASRVDGALVLHDLEWRCRRAQRPVTFGPARGVQDLVVHSTQPVASEGDEHYVPFGCGARRCPGEWLTYVMLTTLRVTTTHDAACPARWMGLNRCS